MNEPAGMMGRDFQGPLFIRARLGATSLTASYSLDAAPFHDCANTPTKFADLGNCSYFRFSPEAPELAGTKVRFRFRDSDGSRDVIRVFDLL